MSYRPITVVESEVFAHKASSCMSDEEREAFIASIACNPEAGRIMVGTGGVRNIRWGVASRGKSHGVRGIYYYHNTEVPLFLLTVFAKSEQANLSQQEKNLMKQLTDTLVKEYQTRKKR